MSAKDQWLYPLSVTSFLRDARGPQWQSLTDYVASLDEEHEDSLAFGLLMVQLCGCATCQPGSYRLSLGCGTCAYRTVANIKCSDIQVLHRYTSAQDQVRTFLGEKEPPR